MAVRIQIRRGTASKWESENPTLMSGELGYETDSHQWKAGDGSTAWNDLPYAVGVPAHEWDGTQIRFQNPDGSWGDWTELGEEGALEENKLQVRMFGKAVY